MIQQAFSPICNPTKCPWGEKAFTNYLQGGVNEAKETYDATELIAKIQDPVNILVDYVRYTYLSGFERHFADLPKGTGDNFYKQGQLLPEKFAEAAKASGHDETQVHIRSQEGYDHSYFFVRILIDASLHVHLIC